MSSSSDTPAPVLSREGITAAVVVAVAFGVGSLVLQRWIASTRIGAIVLVVVWFLVLVVAAGLYARRHPQARKALVATMGAVLIGSIAVGYWTGFRDRTVDEDIVVASSQASGQEREAGLVRRAGLPEPGREGGVRPRIAGGGNVHRAGRTRRHGHREVVRDADGDRTLTFSEFDVDPGVDVDVYLAPSGRASTTGSSSAG